MNDHSNTNWNWSVTGIAIRDNTVLLARHTYGGGKGKWIVPGGYLENGESPEDAVKNGNFWKRPVLWWSRRT